MKFTSEYTQLDFKKKIIPRYISSSLFTGQVLVFFSYALFLNYNNGTQTRGSLSNLLNGFKLIDSEKILTLVLIGIPISLVLTSIFYFIHNFKKLIVELNFNDNEEILKITTRKINTSKLETKSLKYEDVVFDYKDKIYDAMAKSAYSGTELKSNSQHLGYLLRNHFVWNESTRVEIIDKIKSIKN